MRWARSTALSSGMSTSRVSIPNSFGMKRPSGSRRSRSGWKIAVQADPGPPVHLLHHLLNDTLPGALQRIDGAALGPHRCARRVAVQRVRRIAHISFGLVKRPAGGARPSLTLLHPHPAERFPQLAKRLPDFALGRGSLLRGLGSGPPAPRLRLTEAPVHQRILALDKLAKLAQRLIAGLRLRAHLLRPARAQVLQQILQRGQHLPCCVARARAHEISYLVQDALKIGALEQALVRVEGQRLLLVGPVLHLLRKLPHEAVQRALQLVHQALELLVRRIAGKRLHQVLLRPPQLALRDGELSVLDSQRGVPQEVPDAVERAVSRLVCKPTMRGGEREERDDPVLIGVRIERDVTQRAPRSPPCVPARW